MTGEELAKALSPSGLAAVKEYLGRSAEIENRLSLMHARMEQWRMREQQLDADGQEGEEKEALAALMRQTGRDVLAEYRMLMAAEKEMEALIAKVPRQQHRAILEMRHLHHLTFFAIAEKMYMDERHIYKVYKKALESVSVIWHEMQAT